MTLKYFGNQFFFFQAKSDAGNGWVQPSAGGQSDADAEMRRSEPETEYNRRSDVDTDYRREMLNSVHSEARGRDGGRRDVEAPEYLSASGNA